MPRIEESIDIAVSPADLFRFCHNLARRPEWDERVSGIELLTPGPVRRGSLLSIDACRGGEYVFSWDAEYADYKFPHSSSLRVVSAAPSSPFHAGSESWEFSPSDSISGGTRLTLVWDYDLRGFIARLLDVLGRRAATRRAIRRTLTNLKETVEVS